MSLPLVSVIILSYNRKDELLNTLSELAKQSYLSCEIIVVDNNSTDDTCALVEKNYPKILLIKNNSNQGIKGYNTGFEKVKGKYLLILDDDSYPAPDAVEKAVQYFEDNEKIGIIAFKIFDKDGQSATSDWPEKNTSFWGCGAMARVDLLRVIGFYDSDLFLYCNEYDLAIRVWNAGYEVIYKKEITACHRVSATNRVSGRLVYFSVRNDIWFNLKYFKVKYLFRTLPVNLFTWFVRAILEGTIIFWFKGLIAGFVGCSLALSKRAVVNDSVARLYIKLHKNFELPYRKLCRKYNDGTLFKKPTNA